MSDVAQVEQARAALNRVPWWRPIKRQEAARRYRYALLAAALATDVFPPANGGVHHPRCTGQHQAIMGGAACVLSPDGDSR